MSDKKIRRRLSLSRSMVSRYALKTRDSGEFCVVSQGKETVHQWKDLLTHRQFEFLLPEMTADDEDGAFQYLVVDEEEDTEYESEEEPDKSQLQKQKEIERLRREKEKQKMIERKKRMKSRMFKEQQKKSSATNTTSKPSINDFYIPSEEIKNLKKKK
eukprot:306667_1